MGRRLDARHAIFIAGGALLGHMNQPVIAGKILHKFPKNNNLEYGLELIYFIGVENGSAWTRKKMTDKPHKPKGRPTGYRKEYNAIALRVCALFGATDEDLAKIFDTSVNPINEWKRKNPDFKDAVHKGKEMFDTGKVEASLLKRALGYQIKETHQEKDADGTVTGEKIIKKWVISDTAILFWLKNRNPKRWRDLKAVELSNKEGETFKTVALTAEMTAEESGQIYDQMIKGEG